MITVSVRSGISINGNDMNDGLNYTGNVYTSGSNYTGNSIVVPTTSWLAFPTGSNPDFLVGAFVNQDSSSLVYISLGTTTATASILTPNSPSCQLSYSGSAQVYARAVGPLPVNVSYKIVALN